MPSFPNYPFPDLFPSALPPGTPIDPDLLYKLGQVVAAAADGRAYTDLSVVKNWRFNNTFGGAVVGGVPVLSPWRRWMTFGVQGGAVNISHSRTGGTWTAAVAIGSGFSAVLGSASNGVDKVVVCGTPSASSIAKAFSLDVNLASATVGFTGFSNTNSCRAIAYSASLGKWIASLDVHGTFISDDATTGSWTNVDSASPYYFLVKEGTSPLVLGIGTNVGGGGGGYIRTNNGLSWTSESYTNTGTKVQSAWSDYLGRFVVANQSPDEVWVSSTGLTGSWTRVNTGFRTAGIGAYGRVLVCGDGTASIDGGVTWTPIVELLANDMKVATSPTGVLISKEAANGEHLLSYLTGVLP